jgi:two-component system response regulator YesN
LLNVLIVDDEIHFVEAVKKMVDWLQLGISNVYVAYNPTAAERIFEVQEIHVLLCDIEMPQRSGLELLKWMREKEIRTVPLLMTCHADFHYAQEAVRLGCSNYLLKPLTKEELEAALRKAADAVKREQELADAQRIKIWWSRQQDINRELFWLDVLNETIPAVSEIIAEEAAARQVSLPADSLVLPVLMIIRGWQQDFLVRDRKLLEYGLKNAGKELLGRLMSGSVVVPVGNDAWLLIMPVEQGQLENGLAIMCSRLIEFCRVHLYCELYCYGGRPVQGHELPALLAQLQYLDENNVTGIHYVALNEAKCLAAAPPALPDMSGWAAMMRKGVKERLLEEARACIHGLRDHTGIDGDYLRALKENFLQMAHAVLQQQGVQAHLMFCDEESLRLAEAASRSLTDLERWLAHVIMKAMNTTHPSSISDVIERATRYIVSNLDQSLSRETTANHVYLHPDYLTRLFKKELGCTIPEYILKERIKLARQLLIHSELPVSAVAMATGYSNFSHFAKLFKAQSGLSPIEFRQHGRDASRAKSK